MARIRSGSCCRFLGYEWYWEVMHYNANRFFYNGNLVAGPPSGGRLADKYGRKPMILRASVWLGLIMIALGFAHTFFLVGALLLLNTL